jgi:valyl-tRNA synthetase
VDPSTDVPPGFDESQRGKPGGFIADPDVMDTWATSSLTPQIASGWEEDPDLFSRVFPMDLRPQAHDIIRTWLFTTVVRSDLEFDCLPWRDTAISGWILDPDRKKMSKSKGNVVTPMGLLEQYGSDAVRYWAASGRPGTDTAFDEGQMRIGRKLAIKILNASRFVLETGDAPADATAVREAVDRSLLAGLGGLIDEVTTAFEGYDYARALERTESFFWTFCDDYLELVKNRAYGTLGDDRALSARAALRVCLSVLLRLFAPILPFVTEEVWSWWQEGSVHRAVWPSAGELPISGDPSVLEVASQVLAEVRRAKTEAGVSLRAPVASVVLRSPAGMSASLEAVLDDLRQAGVVEDLRIEQSAGDEDLVVEVILAS